MPVKENAAHGAGTPKSSKPKYCTNIVAQIFQKIKEAKSYENQYTGIRKCQAY